MVSRILLLLNERRIELLLAGCLQSFELVTFSQNNLSSIDIEKERIDLVILDVESVIRHNATVKIWRQTLEPVLLPTLVILTDQTVNSLNANLRQQLDAFISLPIDSVELDMNLALLQQVRQFSCKLSRQEQALKEGSEKNSRMISKVIHELRNPLSVISALTQILQRKEQTLSADKKQEITGRIQSAVKKLAKLIEGLLAFNKNVSAKEVFNPKPFDLRQQCLDTLNNLRLVTGDSRKLDFHKEGDFSNVCLDKALVSTILNNLLSNAIKYSPSESTVLLSLKRRETHVAIAIQDAGQGISAEEKPFLFDAFFRTRSAVNIEGTGLGLSIVKQCVELHEGQIEVQSQIKKGTTVTVLLPSIRSPIVTTADELHADLVAKNSLK